MQAAIHAMLGATVMGCFVAAVFFARFWATSRDRFFGFFAAAFVLLAVNWIGVIQLGSTASESRHLIYVLRLVAFVLIALAIFDKNRRSS
jgi:hypothetical protein